MINNFKLNYTYIIKGTDMESLLENLLKPCKTIKIDNNFYEIKTNVEFKKGIALKSFIKKINGKYILTDNQNTLRFMNTLYELTSTDVKQCINDIVKKYDFKIEKGEILTEVTIQNCNKKFFEFIICCSTLANMYIFFDEPKEV